MPYSLVFQGEQVFRRVPEVHGTATERDIRVKVFEWSRSKRAVACLIVVVEVARAELIDTCMQ